MIFTPEQQRNHVRSLQQALRHFAPELITDGFYGPETTDAVRRFQREENLPETGNADRQTWDRIFASYFQHLADTSRPQSITPFRNAPLSLPLGARSSAVGLLQVILTALSRRFENLRPVPVTSVLDEATLREVQQLQRIGGIPVTDTLTGPGWDQAMLIYNAVLKEPLSPPPEETAP